MHLSEMEDRAERLDPDELRTMAADVEHLVAEVRKLRVIQTRVEEQIADKREAADEYFYRVQIGTVEKTYGYRMSSKLMAESNYLERVLKD